MAAMYHTFNSCGRGLTVGVHINRHTWTANLTITKKFESSSRNLKHINFLLNPLGSKLMRNIQKLILTYEICGLLDKTPTQPINHIHWVPGSPDSRTDI